MFKIVERRYWLFLLSALIIIPGLVFLTQYGLRLGNDFAGGSRLDIKVAEADSAKVTNEAVAAAYKAVGFEGEPQIVRATDADTGEETVQLRGQSLAALAKTQGKPYQDVDAALRTELGNRIGSFEVLSNNDVGPTVAAEVTENAAIAVLLAAVAILIYLTIQFRSVPNSFRYGVTAIVAMLHDVLVVVGLAAILGHYLHWEVDALFLTALLTVIGFSVHDTIVVFDRIRENMGRMRGVPYDRVVNHSLIQTLDRSINTSLTAVLTLSAIWLYAEGQLKTFVFWLLIGIISGTYSSICNAAPMMVAWHNREWRTWFGRNRGETARA
ncbi:MAG: protein translocase subunit SecF [Anaerolineae bacterium]|nr:protein translocase subunit SecF [Ardenticatenia bacterium]MBK8540116.1 protein translocase subunit SecF [Ardenticatenia bacterium]HQZ71189.1 protein translocase subunit SecF [Anaerolineae bacterium]HRA19549.1 protein translocase subunit SecF [Anaerolineae bacterium]